MYPVDFPARFETAQRNKSGEINCISAAHFLLGITDLEDYILTSFTTPSYISRRFKKVGMHIGRPLILPDEAVGFGITSPEYDSYWHMGIISPYNRAELIQRPAYDSPVEITTFDKIFNDFFDASRIRVDFLTPNPQWFASY